MADRALEIVSMNDPTDFGLKAGVLNVGDKIMEVSGRSAADQIDFHFRAEQSETVTLKVERKNGDVEEIQMPSSAIAGLEIWFEAMDFRRCRCKCPFCFVDQMPKGMRKSLYVKDEDFRLSFLYNNFTTMNDITDDELNLIIEQHNSPQWVSVHVIEEEMRKFIFGRPMKRKILETLHRLADGGISVHTQAVIVPGQNDGDYLRETIESLESLHPNIVSLGVVPVGLTSHRGSLPDIRSYRDDEMGGIIDLVEPYRQKFAAGARGNRFVYPSDEWFVGANREVPPYEDYDGFPQLDNGIGSIRNLLSEMSDDVDVTRLPEDLGKIRVVTGSLGARVFDRYVLPMLSAAGVKVLPRVICATNEFFGADVTCSGLLIGADMIAAVRNAGVDGGGVTFIPPNCLNFDNVTIDEMTEDDLSRAVGHEMISPGESFIESLRLYATRE